MNSLHDQRRRQLQTHFDNSGLKRGEWCKKYDVSPSYLSQVLSEGFRFGEKAARSLEKKLGLAEGSLDSNSADGLNIIEVWDDPCQLPHNAYALVPQLAVSLSATEQSKNQGEDLLPPLAFQADWIKRKNVTSRDNLRTCKMQGDAMEPYLQDGDTVLIDTGQTDITDNDIYVIGYGDELRVKRLSKRFDGGLLIRSDNARHPDEALSASESHMIKIMGKMLWRGG